MSLTLVGLAAGMGSRFGGPKQLEPLGPGGETMLDFAIHDALRAGFDRVVLVIQPAMHDVFERGVVARWRPRLVIELVHQELDALPAGMTRPASRRKPWGTGQAVLAAEPVVDGPFAVVNGDDFYGRAAYEALAAFLGAPTGGALPVHAVVGFPLAETLSEAGSVNRALLEVTSDGWLSRIQEVVGIEAAGEDGRVRADGGETRLIPGSAPVSMNMWGFAPDVFATLADAFASFLERHAGDERAEFLLPTHVQELVQRGRARVRVLPGKGPWCGITHPEDRARVAAALRAHVERGEYPRLVWA
jgi:NDP-sugar pyrophosphorylase family protein